MCKNSALGRAQNRAYPFCSPRCQMLDLGAWFDESYRVPERGGGNGRSSSSEGQEPGEGEH
ncbi:MAG: DNA gyrase inhibitor YacG [Bradymonadaceae bacterium]|nr:DNA gyrase inhibitor YacG [Lujinxingiaceae bacterium]